MEQSLLDKYKVDNLPRTSMLSAFNHMILFVDQLAMNLLNTELAKHDWPAHFIPTFHMDGIHKHNSKAHHADSDKQGESEKQKGGAEGSREERRHDEIMRQRDHPFNLQLMSPVEGIVQVNNAISGCCE